MPSAGYVDLTDLDLRAQTSTLTDASRIPDTIKVRMQLSRRARAPGVRLPSSVLVSTSPCHAMHSHLPLLTVVDRRQPAALCARAPTSWRARRPWRCTRAWAPCSRASCPRWPSASPATSGTSSCLPTRPRGVSAGRGLLSVSSCFPAGFALRLKGNLPLICLSLSFEFNSPALTPRARRGAAGLAAGVTEAVAVVTPMEVVKIRLQAQHHSMADPLDVPKYRNAAHALYTVVREEGPLALYRGVSLTALRQGSNQAVNFSAYTWMKAWAVAWRDKRGTQAQQRRTGAEQASDKSAAPAAPTKMDLPAWQTMAIGLVSGAMGPLSNAPVDTIKTRLQKTRAEPGQSAVQRIASISRCVFTLPVPRLLSTLCSDLAPKRRGQC